MLGLCLALFSLVFLFRNGSKSTGEREQNAPTHAGTGDTFLIEALPNYPVIQKAQFFPGLQVLGSIL